MAQAMERLQAAIFILVIVQFVFGSANSNLKCLVCRQVVEGISTAVQNEDPKKKIQVGSFRIQPDGSQKQTEVKYAGSELHLHEVLETVCNSLNDYAQATHKETGELVLLNLAKDVDKLSSYELVQDPELNGKLKYYCETFIESFEDDIIAEFGHSMKEEREPDNHLCQTVAGYCMMGPDSNQRQEL